ncbi:expressed unknown protein [Seminavis robusta]|uniref:Uncharacterized protein n=1 Tax=Seminavis robusta TaxID=568900 RepID=A0A9N8EH74_9STRA|nr:expressed unknown protein [Seminavis robusta]|eukprot:Sro1199_g251740.1 n/a (390) ;mRNA; f:15312-16481
MKFAAASLLILTLGGTSAFRDKSQKKNTSKHRGLEEDCVVNHHHAKTVEEIQVEVKTAHAGNGMFDLSLNSPPYAPAGKSVTTTGWCIDYSRSIEAGSYSMDVFSAFDSSIHSNAIDKPAMLPNLAWLINNVNVGDTYPSSDDCVGGTLSWWDMQGAVWMLVDNENGEGTHYETNRVECISQGLAQRARNEGEGYEPDCNDPFEMIPLVMVADNDATGEITNQVIISETLLSTIDGICECATPAPTSSPTKATDAPTGGPTASPTKSTDAPTGGPTASPTKATDAPTGGPTASPTEATDAPTGSPTAHPPKLLMLPLEDLQLRPPKLLMLPREDLQPHPLKPRMLQLEAQQLRPLKPLMLQLEDPQHHPPQLSLKAQQMHPQKPLMLLH